MLFLLREIEVGASYLVPPHATTHRPRPSRFARYNASSARRFTSSGVSPGAMAAKPADALNVRVAPSYRNGVVAVVPL